MSKLSALVHHIIHECRDRPDQLGAVRLNKALWFADVTAYKMYGESITGAAYVKQPRGPVAHAILPVLAELQERGVVAIFEPKNRFDARRYVSLKEPSSRALSNRDKQIADAVLGALLGRTANAVSEMSHDDIWRIAKMGEEIPLAATLAADGELTTEGLDWAFGAMNKLDEAAS